MNLDIPEWANGLAEQIIQEREPPFVVKGGISPSGPIHVGHLNEILRPYFVAEALRGRGYEVEQYLTIDDLDPLESIPEHVVTPEEHLGLPLTDAEIIGPNGRRSYADVYTQQIGHVLQELGLFGQVSMWRASREYEAGTYDEYIELVLDREDEIAELMEAYQETEYTPYNDYKLGWRVEWAVQWDILDVDFEPFGKDHAESSYDSSCDIARTFLDREPPVPLEYEWFTIDGAAMSSSSGVGIGARELLRHIGRGPTMYLYTQNPRRQRELDMRRIYHVVDQYDDEMGYDGPSFREAASYWLGDRDMSEHLFSYSDYDDTYFERVERAGRWAEVYEPEYDYTLVAEDERSEPTRVVEHILIDASHDSDAETLQNAVYEWASYFDRDVGEVFSELYQHLLGRDDGPRAGRMLAAIYHTE